MLLREVFNSPVDWRMRKHRPDYFDAIFMINNIRYIFKASAFLNNGGEMSAITEWNIEFYPDLDIPAKDRYKILKLGNEVKVFSTVVDIMREFIKEYHPGVISFSAEEPSRKKLYFRLIDTLVPDWDVEQTSSNNITIINPRR